MLQLSAVALLTYQFVANVNTALIVIVSWATSLTEVTGSPLASTEGWRAFLASYQTIRLATDPIALPFKVWNPHTYTCTIRNSYAHSHTHTLTHSLTLTLAHPHIHTSTPTHSHSHSHTHTSTHSSKAGMTLVSVASYRNFVRSLQARLPLRSKPNLNRALALLAAFMCHTGALAGFTWAAVFGITRIRGFPMFAI